MKTKHTPGPWKIQQWDYPAAEPPRKELVLQSKTKRLAVLDADFTGDNPYIVPLEEAEANARLIAAAPELLEVLADIELRLTQARIASTIGPQSGKHGQQKVKFLRVEIDSIGKIARAAIDKATN